MFRKILIANRGEIAVRIARACRELGIKAAVVFSEADRTALHVRQADEAYPIGPPAARDSYLNIERILEAARRAGADAVHPGYGFLAENEAFAAACEQAGLVFVGPHPRAVRTMGSKTEARKIAIAAGVPVVPGLDDPILSEADAEAAAARLGFPVLLKAVAGGGGKGMRLVAERRDLPEAWRAARSEAASSFGDPAVYLEKALAAPRHVEIQVLGDLHGALVAFVERECSIQRRHQKVIEESPSPIVDAPMRKKLAEAALAVARAVAYTSAGTIEFLVDADRRFYFLEMNTRLQVEHPVTELVTGVDLVKWQIRIAAGERLDLDQAVLLSPNGHAIECRIYAEDPDNGFLPSPGRITWLRAAGGPGIRDDSGVYSGAEVTVYYDPMISKLIAWGADRLEAIARMARALGEYQVRGIKTTLPLYERVVRDARFLAGAFDAGFIDEVLAADEAGAPADRHDPLDRDLALIATAIRALRPAPNGGSSAGNRSTRVPSPAEARGRESAWKRAARLEACD